MGLYINPPDMTKEAFLKKHGKKIDNEEVMNFDYGNGEVPVCVMFNLGFTAAGVAYDHRERDAFMYPDGRLKIWFSVPVEVLDERAGLPNSGMPWQ